MAVKRTRFRYPGDRWEYQQLLERCGRQLAVWMPETCLDTRPAPSLRLQIHRSGCCCQLAGMGNNLNQIARKINGGQWSGADRVQVVAR